MPQRKSFIDDFERVLSQRTPQQGSQLPMHALFNPGREFLGTKLLPSRPEELEGNAFANPLSGHVFAGESAHPAGGRREAYPTTLTHELGHTEQVEKRGSLDTILRSIFGIGSAAAKGQSAHSEGGSSIEEEANRLGIERVARYADQGDPEAIELLQQITPLIEAEEQKRQAERDALAAMTAGGGAGR